MTKAWIAALAVLMTAANVSGSIPDPMIAKEPPQSEFICIGIRDTLPTREEVEAKIEAEKAEAERQAAEAAQRARAEKIEEGKIFTVLATAYTHTGRTTATGTWPVVGRTIAVDPRVIPLGSHVLINGVEYIAEDTGGFIKGRRIDIFMDTKSECDIWGAQYIEVEVMK